MSNNSAVHRADVRPTLNPFVLAGAADRKRGPRHRAWWAPVGAPSLFLGALFVLASIILTLVTP